LQGCLDYVSSPSFKSIQYKALAKKTAGISEKHSLLTSELERLKKEMEQERRLCEEVEEQKEMLEKNKRVQDAWTAHLHKKRLHPLLLTVSPTNDDPQIQAPLVGEPKDQDPEDADLKRLKLSLVKHSVQLLEPLMPNVDERYLNSKVGSISECGALVTDLLCVLSPSLVLEPVTSQ